MKRRVRKRGKKRRSEYKKDREGEDEGGSGARSHVNFEKNRASFR